MPQESKKKAPDPRRSAAAKKAAETRRLNQEAAERAAQREEQWKRRIQYAGATVVGFGILINEMFLVREARFLNVGVGLGLLGYNVASLLDNIGKGK